MCGIAGWIGSGPQDEAAGVERMVVALRPRGPDDTAVWRGAAPVVLGHARLSIIDLAKSRQPMANEDGTVHVVYNGEIYNFGELRRDLVARGHRFRTEGDTEVLVHLYEEYGAGMVERLDGMFAFGIYDARRHAMLLARDRIGIKPLYYRWDPTSGSLLFASDLRGMLAHPATPRRLEPRALAQYLHFGFVVHPLTWLQGVAQLGPGGLAEWHEGRLRLSRYYAWEYRPDQRLAEAAVAEEALRARLAAAVESHLVSDVPLGSFLSGGLDSATVTALAQQARAAHGGSLHSMTFGLEGTAMDETERARATARCIGTQHAEVEGRTLPFSIDTWEHLLGGLTEPFGNNGSLSMYILCRDAREQVKVALSGDGGDELFLGYAGIRKQRFARRLQRIPRPLRRALAALPAAGPDAVRRSGKYARLSLLDGPGLVVEWARRWEPGVLGTLLEPSLHARLFPGGDASFPEVRELIGAGATGGFAEQQIRFFMLVDLPCDSLFKVDRMSMLHGLEVRVPMLANDMLDFGAELPLERREVEARGKQPLRAVAEALVPTLAQPSPKKGFSFPVDAWMRRGLGPLWRDHGIVAALAGAGFRADALEALIGTYGAGADSTARSFELRLLANRLYDLTVLGLWLEREGIQA